MGTPKRIVRRELHKIHQGRNRTGYVLALVAVIISVYFQSQKLNPEECCILPVALIFTGTIFRILIGEFFFDSWCQERKWALWTNLIGLFLITAGMGAHLYDIQLHYGPTSLNTSYTLLLILTFIMGASTTLAADRPSYYTYVSSLAFFTVLSFVVIPGPASIVVVLQVVIFTIFSFLSFKVASKQVDELLISRASSNLEKEKLKSIIDTVPGFVGLVDPQGIVYMANQATLAVIPNVVGKKIGELHDHSNWEKFIGDFLRSDKKSDIKELQLQYQDKEEYALLKANKTSEGGAIVMAIITTELVQAQTMLREQEAKSQYTAKLASLGEMAAGIAHEINNPLTIIQGSATILGRLVEKGSSDQKMINLMTSKIIETVDRISKIVKSLKALSRNGEDDPKENISIQKVISQGLDLCGAMIKSKGIDLRIDLPATDVFVFGREIQLSQVVINLLSNAIDAVSTCTERCIEIRSEATELMVSIYVSDSGPGIAADIRNKIMVPFFTTKELGQGTGLGLSISRSIIKEHNGELTLLSDTSKTTFKISLPRVG